MSQAQLSERWLTVYRVVMTWEPETSLAASGLQPVKRRRGDGLDSTPESFSLSETGCKPLAAIAAQETHIEQLSV